MGGEIESGRSEKDMKKKKIEWEVWEIRERRGYGRNEKTRWGRQGGENPERITRRRRSRSNGDAGWVRSKAERQDGVFSPSSLLLSHPFLWVVPLQCLTEKQQRQICSLQPLLATNEFRLHPNELLTEPLLYFYQSKTCKDRSMEFQVWP